MDTWSVPDLYALVRRAAPLRRSLTHGSRCRSGTCSPDAIPATSSPELRPRITGIARRRDHGPARWPASGRHQRRHNPDRGLFGVFLVGDDAGRRVGEPTKRWSTNPESGMSSRWAPPAGGSRRSRTTAFVTPRPVSRGRLPFWKGETQQRPSSRHRARRLRPRTRRRGGRRRPGACPGRRDSDPWAADNLIVTWPSNARQPGGPQRYDNRHRTLP